jgi:very-short-patch-repair endonuclease
MRRTPCELSNPMTRHKDYTTQATLAAALREIFASSWRGNEVVVPGSRRRWDMAYSQDNRIVVVEYDGDEHYRSSLKIKVDHEKDAAAKAQGYGIVRFPYWVQLDTATLWHYFHVKKHIATSFPHGFITTEHYPASFCELGIVRFQTELTALPSEVRQAVVESLQARSKEHGVEYVLPSTLRYLIAA